MAWNDEDEFPRGWSMKRGHRKRLALPRGEDLRYWGRSTVKRSMGRGSRSLEKDEEKNKSHKQQVRLWQQIRLDVLDPVEMDEDWYSSDCDSDLEVIDVDGWDVASLAETASTTASTTDIPVTKKKDTSAWDRAVQKAAVNAKRFHATQELAKAERAQKERRAKVVDPEVQELAQRLHQQHRIKLLCPEFASRRADTFEAFRLQFLKDFGSSIGTGLQTCYQGEVELRCAPMSKHLQGQFLSCKEKQPDQLCPVLHGTDDKNLPSIYQKGLLVPTGQNNVQVLHGSSHGKGIYTAKTQNTALSFGFSKGLSRPLLICGALDDAVPLPQPVKCGNHFITAESSSVRHVGDAIVVFNEAKLIPLFVASFPGIAPPLKPGPVATTAPVVKPTPAVLKQVVVTAETKQKAGDGPVTRLPRNIKTPPQFTMAFLSRRGARKRRP